MANRVEGSIKPPGDKSISHRALMLAAISDGECEIEYLSSGRDIESTAECLRNLGVKIFSKNGKHYISGLGFRNFKAPENILDCGNSGTTLRLLTGLLAASNIETGLDGDDSLRRRPIKRVIEPLNNMGADIEASDGNDRCPVRIHGVRLKGVSQILDVPSAQVKTAVLIAGLLAEGVTKLTGLVNTRDHTERILSYLDVDIKTDYGVITLKPPENIRKFDIRVPADPSSAAFPIVAALLSLDSELIVSNLLLNPGRIGYLRILRSMGAQINIINEIIQYGETTGEIVIKSSFIKGIDVKASEAPSYIDEAPILALAATQADGQSVFRGLYELRHKESDRLKNITMIINGMGGKAVIDNDDLVIDGPSKLRYYEGDCYGDHRLAMMIEVGNIISSGTMSEKYNDIVGVSFKGFYDTMKGVLI
ncbi:MAG: 3-phosphoshikimate 1-carboxyvinyltransferase [candidate division Zixibacteria bacterium]